MKYKAVIDGVPVPLKSFSGGKPVATKPSGSAGQISHATAGPTRVSDLTLVVYLEPKQNVIAKLAHAVATKRKDKRVRINRKKLIDALEANHTIGYKVMKNLARVISKRFLHLRDEVMTEFCQNMIDGW